MKIAGILFDKDGTLLDFNEFWVPAAQRVIRRIFSDYRISLCTEMPDARSTELYLFIRERHKRLTMCA